eukprot:CAMPEP_0175296922 /NCGR_PEP_ID=MMETSP0093-20121207/59293_1 /TAXON_ID=311494 /ORGANISM="Alexandrium monilatum, Strain CCMP3105" /LENGTH=76 /DNA_ID=CAMNT_0016592963 /DNA_START=11 /DNA_END=238 /DNA_ORIENTATION=-
MFIADSCKGVCFPRESGPLRRCGPRAAQAVASSRACTAANSSSAAGAASPTHDASVALRGRLAATCKLGWWAVAGA